MNAPFLACAMYSIAGNEFVRKNTYKTKSKTIFYAIFSVNSGFNAQERVLSGRGILV